MTLTPDRPSVSVTVADAPDIWAQVIASAKKKGISRTAWVRTAMREKLEKESAAADKD